MACYRAHLDAQMPVLAGTTSWFVAGTGKSLAARINVQPSGY